MNGGTLILSESSFLRRSAWFHLAHQIDPTRGFALILPSWSQAHLVAERFTTLVDDFASLSELGRLAGETAAALELTPDYLTELGLGAVLAEAGPALSGAELRRLGWQVTAWQAAGWLTSDAVRSAAPGAKHVDVMARAEQIMAERLDVAGLPTGPWCQQAVTDAIAGGRSLDGALDTHLYLDFFHTLSPVARGFINAVATQRVVALRVRSVGASKASWLPEAEMIMALSEAAPHWDHTDDERTSDFAKSELLAESLFPDPPAKPGKLQAGKRTRLTRPSPPDTSIGEAVRLVQRLWKEGEKFAVVAVPDHPDWLEATATEFSDIGLPIRFHLPWGRPVYKGNDSPVGAFVDGGPIATEGVTGDLTGDAFRDWLTATHPTIAEAFQASDILDSIASDASLGATKPVPVSTRLAQLRGGLATVPLRLGNRHQGEPLVCTHAELSALRADHTVVLDADAAAPVDDDGGWHTARAQMGPPIVLDAIDDTHEMVWFADLGGTSGEALEASLGRLEDWTAKR